MIRRDKALIFLFSGLFLAGTALSAYFESATYGLIALALPAIILLVQNPVLLFYLLIVSIPWSIEYKAGGNLSLDFPDELFMLLASATVIVYFIYRYKRIKWYVHPLAFIIILQLLWAVITVLTSTEIIFSLKYLLAKTWYFLAFVALPLILFKNERMIKRSAVLLTSSMLIMMFVALARHAQDYWSFEKVNDALEPFFNNHVSYSALLVFTVPLQIAAIQLSSSAKTKIFVGGILIITGIALYFSYSRGSWLALAAGLVSYWILKRRLLFPGFIAFICIIVISIFWLRAEGRYLKYSNDYRTTIFHSNFRQHLVATYKLKDLSNAERIYRWVAGVHMVPDNWKTGTGPTTFYSQYKSYTVPAFKTYVSDNKEQSTVHNYFLLVAIEQGIMGLLLFVALVASIFWYAQKVFHQAREKFWKVVAAAIASVIVMVSVVNFLSDMIETDKVGSIFYLCIAVLIIADIKTGRISDLTTDVKRIS